MDEIKYEPLKSRGTFGGSTTKKTYLFVCLPLCVYLQVLLGMLVFFYRKQTIKNKQTGFFVAAKKPILNGSAIKAYPPPSPSPAYGQLNFFNLNITHIWIQFFILIAGFILTGISIQRYKSILILKCTYIKNNMDHSIYAPGMHLIYDANILRPIPLFFQINGLPFVENGHLRRGDDVLEGLNEAVAGTLNHICTAGFMKTVPFIYTLLMNTIYQTLESYGTQVLCHSYLCIEQHIYIYI